MSETRDGSYSLVVRLGLSVLVLSAAVLTSPLRAVGTVPGQLTPTPGWETSASNPDFKQPSYPIAFVSAPVVEEPVSMCRHTTSGSCIANPGTCPSGYEAVNAFEGTYHLGTDVVSASDPSPGSELWIYLPPHGQVKKLFPRAIHDTNNDIDFSPSVGAVVEPSLSEDGTRIYFAYFQDATDTWSTAVQQGVKLPRSGADLYALDVSALLTNPLANLDNLPLTRLTHRTYLTQGGQSIPVQTPQSRDRDALNPTLASNTTNVFNDYGTVYMHPTEVRTRQGLYLAYVSNKRRLANSNAAMLPSNHNFNLHFAPILSDGTLGPEDNQFQYFTTTSALSPTPLREGLAFSYQATTEDARYWHIQKFDSEGRWGPLTGYGHADQLFHLGSFCVADEGGGQTKDYFISTKYYNISNEGFGSLWKQDLSEEFLGKNQYHAVLLGQVYVPRQEGAFELTALPPPFKSLSHDSPSDFDPDMEQYFGKLTTPRCGGVNELYFSYTPTSANGNPGLYDRECNQSIYRAHIGFRPDFEPWVPGRPFSQGGHKTVIKRTNDDSNLLWPVPLVPWSVRSNGDVTQRVSERPILVPTPDIEPGAPYAQIGTSSLENTDRRPPECYLLQPAYPLPFRYFHPWGTYSAPTENDALTQNQDTWTWVDNPEDSNDFCGFPDPNRILGVAINITSNKSDLSNPGYINGPTPNAPVLEAVKLLGVYSLWEGTNRQIDTSFLAKVPANVPIEFQALDALYGMKLADVRSWHSLKPREARTDCGGCHQHAYGAESIDFDGTHADGNPPVDMVNSTPSISYDANCGLQLDSTTNASESYPEWHNDIWSGLTQYCGSCHGPGGTTTARAALSWDATDDAAGEQVYNQIINRKFASATRGALGSQLFWAARGKRTDGRINSKFELKADYDCSTCGGDCTVPPCNSGQHRWGFHYAVVPHFQTVGGKVDCPDGDQAYADWVFAVGKWIDNHMPRNTGSGDGYLRDWYHPTADVAFEPPECDTSSLRLGWWDDTGEVESVVVRLNGTTTLLPDEAGTAANAVIDVDLPAVSGSDSIEVEVRDGAGNRQIYRKRIDTMIEECNTPPPS